MGEGLVTRWPSVRLAAQVIVAGVVAGNVLESLPPRFLAVLRHPAVQGAVVMNVLDSMGVKTQLRRFTTAVLVVGMLRVSTRFLKAVYASGAAKGNSPFHTTAVVITAAVLLTLQAPPIARADQAV